MQPLTLSRLSLLQTSGSVKSVHLSGQGGAFIVKVSLQSGAECPLVTSRSTLPRRFSSSDAAITALARIGITATEIDASNWHPAERKKERGNPGRSAALRATHKAAAAATAAAVKEVLSQEA